MDRETALQNYREAVSRKIAAFRSHMGDSVLEHAEDWEAVVEKAMKLLGEQMEKGKGVCMFFVFFSVEVRYDQQKLSGSASRSRYELVYG